MFVKFGGFVWIKCRIYMNVRLKARSVYAVNFPKIRNADMKLELGKTGPARLGLRSEIAYGIDFVEESSSRSLSNDRSFASSKASSLHRAIYCFLAQFPVYSRFLKVIQ